MDFKDFDLNSPIIQKIIRLEEENRYLNYEVECLKEKVETFENFKIFLKKIPFMKSIFKLRRKLLGKK